MSESAPRSLILGTSGHIDHGKTSLVRALTGVDTDRMPEEKARGITIDIGFAHLDLGDIRLGIVDVPGHERFVKNMMAGAVGIDVAMLVIAADDSIMPQTREHLSILQMLDIRHGLIALTKADLVEPDWLDIVEDDIRGFVKGTFLETSLIVRTAVANGQFVMGGEELKQALRQLCRGIQPRPETGVFRLPVDRVFNAHGVGTIVTGTVWSGELTSGDGLEWLPRQSPVRVRGIQSHGHEQQKIGRGQRAAANLVGVRHDEIRRGHEIATRGFLRPSKRLIVELNVLDTSPFPLRHRGRYRLHLGTQELMVRVSLLAGTLVEPGGKALAQLICSEAGIATAGQPLVLRLESPLLTVGGGHVLQAAPKRMGRKARRDGGRLARLQMLGSRDPKERAAAAIYFYNADEWSLLDLCRDANLRLNQAAAILPGLLSDGTIISLPLLAGPRSIHRDALLEIECGVIDAINRVHDSSPLESAIARPALAAKVRRICEPAVLSAVLDRLIKHGRIGGDEHAVMRTKHAPNLTAQQIALRERILAIYAAAGLAPPVASDLAVTLCVSAGDMRQLLNLCVAQKLLVHLGSGLYLAAAEESSMRGRAVEALAANPAGLTMSQLRDALGTTRKYAVPFGEYLDRIGVSKRRGDLRVPNT